MNGSVRLRFGPASDHPRFARSTEIPVGKIHWKTKHHADKSVKVHGALVSRHITTGKVGRLTGIMESLSDLPIDGKLKATISRGSAQITGELTVYQSGSAKIVNGILDSVAEATHDLARDSQIREVTITYTFEVTSMLGR